MRFWSVSTSVLRPVMFVPWKARLFAILWPTFDLLALHDWLDSGVLYYSIQMPSQFNVRFYVIVVFMLHLVHLSLHSWICFIPLELGLILITAVFLKSVQKGLSVLARLSWSCFPGWLNLGSGCRAY